MEEILIQLQKSGLKCNAEKCKLCAMELEYLGYILTQDQINPHQNKVACILVLEPPQNVKQLLCLIQYY